VWDTLARLPLKEPESTFFRETHFATVLQRCFVVLMIGEYLHLFQKSMNYEKAFGSFGFFAAGCCSFLVCSE
jgi:hypothetical protein